MPARSAPPAKPRCRARGGGGPRSARGHVCSLADVSPDEVRAVIAAAACERDRLLLHVLWATGARISEVLALRPMDVLRDSLVLPNRKNPNQTVKRVFLPGAELSLTGELLLWAKEQGVADNEPVFLSRNVVPMARADPFSVVRPGSLSNRHRSERPYTCL